MDRAVPEDANRRSLTVEVRRVGSGAVVAPVGELDHHSADALREVLGQCVAEGCPRILIDCSGLAFCDSTGLNVLLATRLDAEAAGGQVHLAAMSPIVARIFEITGATAVFTVHRSVEEALAAMPTD
ncbi:STAS domain-containing protein [Streptomyces radicis]|uniref:Anti-sigma factor antagonist n=1 Tax=Streptomyces radicis TaxID=1750517 RepID=A0A3A9WH06_9ACTN|nr:STAS domain-containing protein [Streptomyces radicis]RKN08714.1 anti-sigma factor antagonist [Streptomyces radicis]RKN21872.1 anti-sigma factor antagonist [Streptomyces radicis]